MDIQCCVVLGLVMSCLVTCGLSASSEEDEFTPFAGKRFDGFDWRLCREMNIQERGNAAVAPIGVKFVLALLYEAAVGTTAQELQVALQFPVRSVLNRDIFRKIQRSLTEKSEGYIMDIENKMYIDKKFQPLTTIQDIYKAHYKTDIEKINFENVLESVQTINSWVKKVTEGRITEVVKNDPYLAMTMSIILNVIYFKGKWKYAFPKEDTTTGLFQTNTGKSVQVNYMNLREDLYYTESKELDAQILRLPYEGKKYSLFLILPKKAEHFHRMLEIVNPLLIREQLQQLNKQKVTVILPKFQFDYTIDLKNILKQIGISRIFNQNKEIILTQNSTFFISKIYQKVGLELNEEGTTAAFATGVELTDKFGFEPLEIVFNASHPFMFFMEEEASGTVVFVGKVVDPTSQINIQSASVLRPTSNYYNSNNNNNNNNINNNDNNRPLFDVNPHQPNDVHLLILPDRLWQYISNGQWLRDYPWSKSNKSK